MKKRCAVREELEQAIYLYGHEDKAASLPYRTLPEEILESYNELPQ